MALFNLLTNPFFLLAVDPAATNQQVDDAARHCTLASDPASARIAILDPTQRLSLELGYPIDSQPKQIAALYDALSRHAPASEIVLLSTELGPLSRANLIAHLAAGQPASGAMLSALIDAQSSIGIPAIFAILRSMRAAAGWVAPSLVSVNEGVQALLALQTQAVIASYASPENAADELSACVGYILDETDQYHLEELANLVTAYRARAMPKLEAEGRHIAKACEALRKQPRDDEILKTLAAAMRDWSAIYRPIMLFDRKQAAGDEQADCADQIRDLIGDLVEGDYDDTALSVAQLARDAFAALPETAAEFDKAIAMIEQWSRDAAWKRLHLCIDGIVGDPSSLNSVLETGFGFESIGDPKELWESFLEIKRLTTSDDEEPWLMVRDLAAYLAERPDRSAVAKAVLSGLIAYAEQVSVSPAIRQELQIEQSPAPDVTSPQAPSLPSKNANPIPPSQFARGEAARKRRYHPANSKFAVIAITGVFGTAAALYYGESQIRSLVWHPDPAATSRVISDAETIPPVGTGQHLDLSGVRYCRYQEERLKIMKPEVKSPEDTRAFNLLVVDYNSRCSDFFFRDADAAIAKAEIAENRERLEADAKAIISTWPGHRPLAKN